MDDLMAMGAESGATQVFSLWSEDFLLLDKISRAMRYGQMTGVYNLKDVFVITNGRNGAQVVVRRNVQSRPKFQDEVTGEVFSQSIKYYRGSNTNKDWIDFAYYHQGKLMEDMLEPESWIDTIQFGRFLSIRDKSAGTFEIEEWSQDLYDCIVWTQSRRQGCPICIDGGWLTRIISESYKYIETEYDIGGDVKSLDLPYPRKLCSYNHKVKRCVWILGAAAHDPILDIESYFSEIDDGLVTANCYHFRMQHGHAHFHRYDVRKEKQINLNGIMVNALDVAVMDILLQTYKTIIVDSKKDLPSGGCIFDNYLRWTVFDLLHEIFLPVKSTFLSMTYYGKVMYCMLIAIIHNGVVLKSIIKDSQNLVDRVKLPDKGMVNKISKKKLWQSIRQNYTVFSESKYCKWIMSNLLNDKIPISRDMITIDKTFLGENYDIPEWVLVTESLSKINKISDESFEIAKKYNHLYTFLSWELNETLFQQLGFQKYFCFRSNATGQFHADVIYSIDLNEDKIFVEYKRVSNVPFGIQIGMTSGVYYHLFKILE